MGPSISQDGGSRACAPVLLLAFNRPDMLRGLLAALAPVKPGKIYLAVDGPRADRPGEAEKCAECAAALDAVDWPCEKRKLVRAENLGCRRSVVGALDWFFSQEEEGIVLEDDCWPDPTFLPFATELLERYRDDPRVGMISGNNYYGFISDPRASYRFSGQALIWGWATWRRSWRLNEQDAKKFCVKGVSIVGKANLTCRGRVLHSRYFKDFLATESTWDVPWMLSLQERGLLSVMPRTNLVANRGCGTGAGTHTAGYSYDAWLFARTSPMAFPLVHPAAVERDLRADLLHELRSFSLVPRALTVFGLRFGAFGRALCSLARRLERMWPALFRV